MATEFDGNLMALDRSADGRKLYFRRPDQRAQIAFNMGQNAKEVWVLENFLETLEPGSR